MRGSFRTKIGDVSGLAPVGWLVFEELPVEEAQ
jgi:hypothetical protein